MTTVRDEIDKAVKRLTEEMELQMFYGQDFVATVKLRRFLFKMGIKHAKL